MIFKILSAIAEVGSAIAAVRSLPIPRSKKRTEPGPAKRPKRAPDDAPMPKDPRAPLGAFGSLPRETKFTTGAESLPRETIRSLALQFVATPRQIHETVDHLTTAGAAPGDASEAIRELLASGEIYLDTLMRLCVSP